MKQYKEGQRIKVRTGSVPDECDYLTPGKVYEGRISTSGRSAELTGDDGWRLYVNLKRCAHLDGGSWEIVPYSEGGLSQ